MEPVTRNGAFMNAAAKGVPCDLTPITREEMLACGSASNNITPATREEFWLQKVSENSGGLSSVWEVSGAFGEEAYVGVYTSTGSAVIE